MFGGCKQGLSPLGVHRIRVIAMASVGIIIPSYNSAQLLPHTIESIRRQTFTDWQCVIVDDGSRDDSREVAISSCKDDSRFSLVVLAENRGTAAARNAGLAALGKTVQYIVFMDSDDVWDASSLQTLTDGIEEHPSWVAVYGNCRLIDHRGASVPHKDYHETAGRERYDYREGRLVHVVGAEETTYCQFLLRNPVVAPGCLLVRAEAIAKINEKASTLFDPGMKYGEDLGAWLRIRRAGCIGYLDQTVLNYRLHSCNKTNRRWGAAASVRKVRLKALGDPAVELHELRQSCAAFRAYRRFRIVTDLRFAASSIYHRKIRAALRLVTCTVVSALDILVMLAFQAGQSVRILARDGVQNARSSRETFDEAFEAAGHDRPGQSS